MKTIKVAIVGAGNVANSMHLPAWNKNIKAKVIAICDINIKNAKKTANTWNIQRVYSDFEKLLIEEPDAVIDLCTPPETHANLCIKALETGHHTLLEKPMAMNLDDCKKILNFHHYRKEKLCVIQNYLFSPSMLQIKSILAKKNVDLLRVEIAMLHTPNDEMFSDSKHWVHSLPGGRFGECLIHPVYLLHNLIGKLEIRDVFAEKRGCNNWVRFDDLHVTFNSDKKFGSIYISFNSPRETSFPSMKIFGKNLVLIFDGTNSSIIIQEKLDTSLKTNRVKDSLNVTSQIIKSSIHNIFKVLSDKWITGHATIFDFFTTSILEDKELPYSPEEAFEANKTFLAILNKLDGFTK